MLLDDRLLPFLPPERRTLDQEEAWWQECYQPGIVERVLENGTGWNLVINRGGEGASTILKAFQRNMGSRALFADYDPRDWRMDQEADAGLHLVNLLEISSQVLRVFFKNDPSKLSLLSKSQREFLHWIIQKYNDRRAYPRWLDSLPDQFSALMREVAYEEDFYTPHEDPKQAGGAVEELGNLVRKVNLEQIVFILDLPNFMSESVQKQAAALFEWLTLMEHPAIRLVGSVPEAFISKYELKQNTRDRLNFTSIPVNQDHVRKIQQNYLKCATLGQVNDLNQMVSPDLSQAIEALIHAEYVGVGLAGWVGLLKILCEMMDNHQEVLTMENLGSIRKNFYTENIVLRVDPGQKIVWRGYKPIKLEDAPFDFLQRLWYARGRPIDDFGFGISQSNKYKLANRVRGTIEPVPGETIYLKNERNLGYWLENTVFS